MVPLAQTTLFESSFHQSELSDIIQCIPQYTPVANLSPQQPCTTTNQTTTNSARQHVLTNGSVFSV